MSEKKKVVAKIKSRDKGERGGKMCRSLNEIKVLGSVLIMQPGSGLHFTYTRKLL